MTKMPNTTSNLIGMTIIEGVPEIFASQGNASQHAHVQSIPLSPVARPVPDWDPIANRDDLKTTPSPQCLLRVKRDMMALHSDPPPGLFVVPDEKDMTVIHALIIGPLNTPYEGGFFYFLIRCPPDYPFKPPRVKLMTTGAGTVRFNPNLYANGKICLSILGTWSGPSWCAAQRLSSVLMSIQSLLNDKPYHNEPGFEMERGRGDIARYNDIIQHETLRVAVCGMLENETCLNIPEPLHEVMEKTFLKSYDYYYTLAQKKTHMTGGAMLDPFGDDRGVYQYKSILARLEALRKKLTEKVSSNPPEQGD